MDRPDSDLETSQQTLRFRRFDEIENFEISCRDEIPRTRLESTPATAPDLTRVTVVNSLMSAPEIVQQLVQHKCRDLTETLDLDSCSVHPLSSGGFGDVYRGRLVDASPVAIKTLRLQIGPSDDDQKHLKRAAREMHVWSKCRHPNVLPLMGLVVFRDQVGMVSLWLEHGSLTRYMPENPGFDRCKMSMGIADGLAYLHDIGVVHGDLKGQNVLVAHDGDPMLTDFGNAVLQTSTLIFTATTQANALSTRWAAPELMDGRETSHSKPADVYALGMTILETFTGQPPFFGKSDLWVMGAVVMRKEVPTRPEAQIPSGSWHGDWLWSLLEKCWANEPQARPTASKVANLLHAITHEGVMSIPVQTRKAH